MRPPRVGVAYAALMLGMLMAALDETIVTTALPTIAGDLGSIDQLALVVTSYILAATVSTPIYGKLGDLFGRKRLFQVAIGVFLVGSALSGAAGSMDQLVGFRAVQGIGAGGLIVGSQAIVADLVAPRERGRYQAWISGTSLIASVAGPMLGGLFFDRLSWRWIFFVNLPVGAFAFVAVAIVVPQVTTSARGRIDALGMLLLVGAAGPITLALLWAGVRGGWSSPRVLAAFGVGIVLLGVFAQQERRARDPVVPLELFRNRVFASATVSGFSINLSRWVALVYIPLFFQVVLGVSAERSGLEMLPFLLASLASAVASGIAVARTGRYKAFPVAGCALSAIGFYLFAGLGSGSSYAAVLIAMLVTGAGLGLVMHILVLALQNAVAPRNLGAATASSAFFRAIGAAFGVAIFGSLLSSSLGTRLADVRGLGTDVATSLTGLDPAAVRRLAPAIRADVVDAFAGSLHTVFFWAIPFALVALVAAWLMRELPLRTGSEEQQP